MSVLSRSVRLHRRLYPATNPQRASVLVDMRPVDQAIVVKVDRGGKRSVGLVFERGGVCVEVELTHPRELDSDLQNALAWVDGDEPEPDASSA